MNMRSLRTRYGDWALITGAARAEGLGFAFAQQLAHEGMNLVLVDMLASALAERAQELQRHYGIMVRPLVLDLAERDAVRALTTQTSDIQIGMLVCNHMYTPSDTPMILDMPLETLDRMMDINARAMALLHTFGNHMRHRKRGGIVVVTSGAARMPTPFTGAYAANKAFQMTLGEVLWYELKDAGVDVVTLVAGLMRTQAAINDYPAYLIAEPNNVVQETLAKLGKQHRVIPTVINKLMLFVQVRLMPRQQVINFMGNFMAKGLGKR